MDFALRIRTAAFLVATSLAAVLTGCGGRGSVPAVTIPMSRPHPPAQTMHEGNLRLRHPIYAFPIARGAGIKVTPNTVTLYGKGKARVQVSESAYKGNFTQKNTCKGVATVALPKGSPAIVTLTGVRAGKCAVEFFDSKGHKGTLAVTDKKAGGSLVTAFYVPLRGGAEKPRPSLHPDFISPSTQSMTFDIAPAGSSSPIVKVVSGLTIGSPNCALTLQGLDCTFNSTLPTGTYNATITMYDAWDPAGDDIPVGAAPLSVSYQSFAIANGATNNVTFNFQGIPAQVGVVPNTPLVTHSGNVYDLIGPGAHSFYVEAFDADNNVIAGIGGPTNYSAITSGALAATVSTPPPGSPRFSVTPPTILTDDATLGTLTVCASYAMGTACPAPSPSPGATPDGCSYTGAVCSGAVTLDMQALLAVASSYSISLFAAEKGIGPVSTITSGVENTTSDIQFDPQGNLYSAEIGTAIHEYTLGSTIPKRTITTPAGDIFSKMALDPAGNLFALDLSANKVFVYPPGATTASKAINVANPAGFPYDIVVDANDDFWIEYVQFDADNAVKAGGNIGFFANGSTTPVMLSGLVAPVGMALDNTTETLYVSDQTRYVFAHPYGCTDMSFCMLYAYHFGSWASPTTISSVAYAGDLQVLNEVIHDNAGTLTIKAVFQDNADGQRFAIYRTDLTPPVTPDAFDAGLQAGATQALVVDQRGNMFAADVFASAVYGYRGYQLIGGGAAQTVTPFVTLTNGLRYPQPMAIVP
ncbi:MAG TPA: hypothetical protein VNF68_07045 [Candidatus Baltobacteraceae bacterium]|nr:hypothetical protein [Candidatus Baltobacteraceae bacterium]